MQGCMGAGLHGCRDVGVLGDARFWSVPASGRDVRVVGVLEMVPFLAKIVVFFCLIWKEGRKDLFL